MKEYKKDCPLKEIMYCPYCQLCLQEAQEEIENELFEEEDPDLWEDDCDYEVGYDPYLGCFSNEV